MSDQKSRWPTTTGVNFIWILPAVEGFCRGIASHGDLWRLSILEASFYIGFWRVTAGAQCTLAVYFVLFRFSLFLPTEIFVLLLVPFLFLFVNGFFCALCLCPWSCFVLCLVPFLFLPLFFFFFKIFLFLLHERLG